MADIRAPRLTNGRLEDLAEVVALIDDNIAYLTDAIAGHATQQLVARLTLKRERLKRGRAWLAGKLEAERAHRAPERTCSHPGCTVTDGKPCAYPACPNATVPA